MGKSSAYKRAGVNIDAGDELVDRIAPSVRSTFGPHVLGGLGGFAGMYRLNGDSALLRKRYEDPVLVACTDGVGTKLKIAFLSGRHRTVGIDLVAMSVNDLVVQGAEPLFFCDYFATGRLEPKVAADVIEGIAEGCRETGCALLSGETAELPGFYADGDYDLAGFAVGIVEKKKIIDGQRIEPGDAVVGMMSTGLHANGYSLARKVLLEQAGLPLDRKVPELGCTLAEELLRPTRIYAHAVRQLLKHYQVKKIIKGLMHITGSGPMENIQRLLPRSGP